VQFRIDQRFGQVDDLGFVDFGYVRMNVRHIRRGLGHARHDLGLLAFELVHPRLHGGLIHAIFDGRHDTGNAAFDLGERFAVKFGVRAALVVLPVELFRVGTDSVADRIGGNELLRQSGQNTALDVVAADRTPIIACAAAITVQATIPVTGDDAVVAATGSAGQQAGEQKGRASQFVDVLSAIGAHALRDILKLLGDLRLSLARHLPQFLIDDAQLRYFGPDPFGFRVDARDALPRRRVLDVAQPVPDQHAGIELVVQNAGAAADMAANGRVAPGVGERTGDALAVEIGGYGARALASGELPEDAADDHSLRFVDVTLSPHLFAFTVETLDHDIAVTKAATRLTLLDPAAQAAMGLGGEVLQEQGVHRALEADVKLGDLAFGQSDDPDAREFEMLVEDGHIGLVARDAVQGFGQHDVELACLRVLQERLDARAEGDAGARYGGVLVSSHDLPLLPCRLVPADTKLVVDRGNTLVVRRVAGVQRSAGHGTFSYKSQFNPKLSALSLLSVVVGRRHPPFLLPGPHVLAGDMAADGPGDNADTRIQ